MQLQKNKTVPDGKTKQCPMEGTVKLMNVIYKCDVTRSLPKKVYLALTERE